MKIKITLNFKIAFVQFITLMCCLNISASESADKSTTLSRSNITNSDYVKASQSKLNQVSNTVLAPDFTITTTTPSQRACPSAGAVVYNFTYTTQEGFSENTVFSAVGQPSGATVSFNPASRSTTGAFTMTVANLGGAALGDYTITVTATSTSIEKTRDVTLLMRDTPCVSNGNTVFQTSTNGVTFNTISNLNTGKSAGGYGDFTNIVTDVNRGSSYSMIVNANTAGFFTTLTYVWIDWNQNCSFDDAGERYIPGFVTNSNNGPTPEIFIPVPLDAVLGNTIMRVSTKYISTDDPGTPAPCLTSYDGETEDYTINVEAQLGIDDLKISNFSIYPNPNKGQFNVVLNASTMESFKVSVFDVSGRNVYENEFENTTGLNQSINLQDVNSGIYLVKVSNGGKETIKKMIIE